MVAYVVRPSPDNSHIGATAAASFHSGAARSVGWSASAPEGAGAGRRCRSSVAGPTCPACNIPLPDCISPSAPPRPQPLFLHLVRRRSPARRLQAIRVRQGHPALHRPAPPRLRAGSHQARRAGRKGKREKAGLNPEPFLLRIQTALLQHLAARPEEAHGRPGPHRREPARLHAGVLARRARHLRELRVSHPDRQAGQVRAALPRHREVRQHRPAPRGRQQRPDGRGVRGADPQVRRAVQRDRRRALHAARGHPADGQPAVHRGRRGADQARRRALALRPHRRHRRHVERGRRAPRQPQPRRPAGHVRAGAEPRVLRHLQGRHADQGPGHRQHHLRQHALRRRPARQALRLHALQSALRRRVEEDRKEIRKEFEQMGFNGRFGPGLPRVSDGSLLFLLHLVSKMRPAVDGGSRFGIVLNGSPLFTGGAGSARARFAATCWKTTWSRPSSACRPTCSTTPASAPTSGSSATASPPRARARCN
jgi:hypothetical protein